MLLLRLEMVLLLLLGLLLLLMLLCENWMVPVDTQRLLLWLLLQQLQGVRPRRVQRVDVVPVFRGQRALCY